ERVAFEVVRDEARAVRVGRVLEQQLTVAIEELRAERDACGELELPGPAALDVVEDRTDRRIRVAASRDPTALLGNSKRDLLDAFRRQPAHRAGTLGRGEIALVGNHREPLVVGTELDGVLLRRRVVCQLRDRSGRDVDRIDIVLLVAGGVLAECDRPIVTTPRDPGAHRARDFAVAYLS